MNTMNFEGLSGSIYVSIVAFSIVFAVLLILTAMIFAMRLFGGSGQKPQSGGNAPAAKAVAPAPVVSAAPAANVSKVVAAIAAAILADSGGRGRVLSITPAGPVAGGVFSTWRASGVVALVNNRPCRPWNR